MITLESLNGRIQILPDGQINLRIDCCAVEDGIASLMHHFLIKLTPLAILSEAFEEADRVLMEDGFTVVPADVRTRVESLCSIEHTPEVVLRYAVEVAKTARDQLLLDRAAWSRIEDEEGAEKVRVADVRLGELDTYILENEVLITHVGIKKECCFSLMEILPDGQMSVRMRKCVVANGVIQNAPSYHRQYLSPTCTVRVTMEDVSNSLILMGCGPLLPEDITRIERICQNVHTPNVVSAYEAAEAARE
jgi:hypothetical protein